MAYQIKLSDITIENIRKCAGEIDFEINSYHLNLFKMTLLTLMINPRINNYAEVYGNCVKDSAEFRVTMAETLYLLWCYCELSGICLLNFLVVSSKSGVPGNAVRREYRKIYGTERGYEEWARMKAEEALFLLKNKIVEVVS